MQLILILPLRLSITSHINNKFRPGLNLLVLLVQCLQHMISQSQMKLHPLLHFLEPKPLHLCQHGAKKILMLLVQNYLKRGKLCVRGDLFVLI